MGDDRHVGDHFVVAELVRFRGLDHAVKGQDPAKPAIAEDDRVLKGSAALEQDFIDLK